MTDFRETAIYKQTTLLGVATVTYGVDGMHTWNAEDKSSRRSAQVRTKFTYHRRERWDSVRHEDVPPPASKRSGCANSNLAYSCETYDYVCVCQSAFPMASNSLRKCSRCASKASMRCSGCLNAPVYLLSDAESTVYCSHECQEEHWPAYRGRCRNL
jgi:hypothetical protein